MRRIIIILAVILFGVENASAIHEQFVINNIMYETVSDTEVIVKWVEDDAIFPDSFCDIPAEVDYDGKFYLITGLDSTFSSHGRNFKNIYFPVGITEIRKSALIGCPAEEIVLPDLKATYPADGFLLQHCNNLKFVDIPECVTDFSAGLSDVPSLETIICRAPIPPKATVKSFDVDFKKVVLKVSDPEAYKNSEGWKLFENIVEIPLEETIFYYKEAISLYGTKFQFIDSTSVKVVSVPPTALWEGYLAIPPDVIHNGRYYNVTAIGPRAFHDATGLIDLVTETVEHIGKDAFRHCDALMDIYIRSDNLPEVEDSVMFPELHTRKANGVKDREVWVYISEDEIQNYDTKAWNTCHFRDLRLGIEPTTADDYTMRLIGRQIGIVAEGDWILDIYNITGAKVYTTTGTGPSEIDTKSIGSGIYVAKLSAGGATMTMKLRLGD